MAWIGSGWTSRHYVRPCRCSLHHGVGGNPERRLGFAFRTNGNLIWVNSYYRLGALADLALKACQ
ncbi:MAG: hypothetical protein HY787_25675 [Deltaproteobacteria bacterium]|nr:hypothetical protein [Deltaproteobacteria bacterium]